MNLIMKIHKRIDFLVCQKMLSLQKLLYLFIVFTKRKVGAHIAMPIKGNVHLLFLNSQIPQYLVIIYSYYIIVFSLKLIVFRRKWQQL